MSEDDRDWQKVCPICLADDVLLARVSNCGHTFCIECLQRLFCRNERQADKELESLLAKNVNNKFSESCTAISTTQQLLQDLIHFNIENIPTIERCPCCRSPISMMAVIQVGHESPVWTDNCINRLEDTPLFGKVFATAKGVGHNSFHFAAESSDSEEDATKRKIPYMICPTATNSKSTGEPVKNKFDDGWVYLPSKRTFHGTISLPNDDEQIQRCNAILCFSPDHLSITGGLMIRPSSLNPAGLSQPHESNIRSKFPFDGVWKVMWFSERIPLNINFETMAAATLQVLRNIICVEDEQEIEYEIQYENNRIYFEWPGFNTVQTLEPECDFRADDGDIPAVGSILRWSTTNESLPYIAWKRITIDESSCNKLPTIEYFGRSGGDRNMLPRNIISRNSLSWYRAVYNDGQNDLIKYNSENLWGNTFCQGLHVGLASYHFCHVKSTTHEQAHNIAYISYESEACQQWPPLDDGSPIPSRVQFRNISVDQIVKKVERSSVESYVTLVVFRGTIEWLQDYGTTWRGSQRWEYEMVFDTQLTCILSGTVNSITESGMREEMSHFGATLVYVNAGILNTSEHLNSLLTISEANARTESSQEIELSDTSTRLSILTRTVQSRLIWEGASRRTIDMIRIALLRAYGTVE